MSDTLVHHHALTRVSLNGLRDVHAQGPILHHRGRWADGHQRIPVGGLNRWLALTVTHGVGSMWAAYVFMGLALVSLPAVLASGDAVIIVAWIAQTFLQLVLLPIIMVGQNVQAQASDARALADHTILGHTTDVLAALHALTEAQDEVLDAQSAILAELQARPTVFELQPPSLTVNVSLAGNPTRVAIQDQVRDAIMAAAREYQEFIPEAPKA